MAQEENDEVVAKYKKLLGMARQSLESNQVSIASKDKQISQLITALEASELRMKKGYGSNPSTSRQEDEAATIPRCLLRRVDIDSLTWILIEYEGSDKDDGWKCFSNEQELDDFIQRIPGVPLSKPPRCLSPNESASIEEECKKKVDRIVEEFRRFKVRAEIARKQKDAEAKQAALIVGNGLGPCIEEYEKVKVKTDKETRDNNNDNEYKSIRLAYEKVVKENEHLKTRGGDAMLASQWREKYETLMKEKDEVEDKLKIYTKVLNDSTSSKAGNRNLERAFIELRDEYKEFRRRVMAIDKQRKEESSNDIEGNRNDESMPPSPNAAPYSSSRSRDKSSLIHSSDFKHFNTDSNNNNSNNSNSFGEASRNVPWSGGGGGLMESKVQYVRQMVFQYLSCREVEVKLHIEAALMAIFRFNEEERTLIEDRKKEDSQDTLTSLASYLGSFSGSS